MNNELRRIKSLIDSLTDDDDLRQELWVHFLSGSNSSTFSNHLEILRLHYDIIQNFQHRVEIFARNVVSNGIEIVLQSFAPVEIQIIYFLILGLTPVNIAEYNCISLAKVNQAILIISKNPIWNTIR